MNGQGGWNGGFGFGIDLQGRDTEEEKVFEDGIPSSLGDLAFYGGQMDFRFNTQLGGRSLTPYLIVGGGYMDVDENTDFVNAAARLVAEQSSKNGLESRLWGLRFAGRILS